MRSALDLLDVHHQSFYAAATYAMATDHPVPCDTRAWSQVLVSTLTGIKGIARKKGPDLTDGSDIKAANVWLAIDTPRFNGCLKAGRKKGVSSISSLDGMPYLFFVLWDYASEDVVDDEAPDAQKHKRCRVWVVRPKEDQRFRAICIRWYELRDRGEIKSDNFQLHPPRNEEHDVITNTCGDLSYPLLFQADWTDQGYELVEHNPEVLTSGLCQPVVYE